MNTNRSIGIFALFFGFAGTVLMAEEKPEAIQHPIPEYANRSTITPDTIHVFYIISPDEKWIYEQKYYGHRMTGGELS